MKIQNPYHEGELEVQDRLGLRAEGERNAVVITDSIIKGAIQFIEQQSMAVLGSIDRDENIWASVLAGQAGFMKATAEQTITFDLSKTAVNEHNSAVLRQHNIGSTGQIIACNSKTIPEAVQQ